MKVSQTTLIFVVALLNSSSAAPQPEKHLRDAIKQKQSVQQNVQSESTFQKTLKDAGDVKSFHSNHRVMEENASYSVASLVESTKRDNQRVDKKKKQAQKEKKVKALGSVDNEAGPYNLRPKPGNKKADGAIPTHNQIETNIVGGDQSEVGEFPYYVDMAGCGGTLIAPNVVLSAAHCGGYVGEEVYVSGYKYGTDDNNAIAVKIVSQVQHPNFDPNTMQNDFYLYKLERDVFPNNPGVSLTLNQDGAKPTAGDDLTVLGLGMLSSGGSTPEFLNDAVVPTMSNQYCGSSQSYGSDFYPDVMLCAGETEKDSCQGDSGGPIVIRNGNNHVLVGVVSWGYGCAEPNYPGIYARVSSAMSWIKSIACDTWDSNASFCGGGNNPSPTPVPQSNPTPVPQPNPSPTPPPQNGPTVDCVMLELDFKTDEYPEETSFFAENAQQGTIMEGDNFAYRQEYHYEECILVDSCTTLQFADSYGDGLLSDGYLTVTWDKEIIHDDWDIGFGYTWEFGNGCGRQSGPTPAPVALTPTPVAPPTPTPVAPTPAPQPTGGGDCTILTLQFKTDYWPEETFVVLQNDPNGLIWDYSGFDADTEYTYTACIPVDICTVLDITDTDGDGLLNDGYMTVTWGSDVVHDNCDIGYGFYMYLGNGCSQ